MTRGRSLGRPASSYGMQARARTRRWIGTCVCLSPALLVVLSLAWGAVEEPHAPMPGLAWMGVALAVGLINVWFSFGRWWLHRARGGELSTFRRASGLPLLGTILVVLGGLVSFGSIPTAVVGVVVLAIDTGGTPWFLVMTWKDESLWLGS